MELIDSVGSSIIFIIILRLRKERIVNQTVDLRPAVSQAPGAIPLVVGLKDKQFALAVQTDEANFMSVQYTRRRHSLSAQDLISLGLNVMTVCSVAAFVNPDKEVDRIVSRIGEIYREVE